MGQSFRNFISVVSIIGLCVFSATRIYEALTRPKQPVELSSTAIDPFERPDGDCKRFEGGFEGYDLPGVPNVYISNDMQERDTFWLLRMERSPWGYSCFLYAAVNGDPRALMPLYVKGYVDRSLYDPFLLSPQPHAEMEEEYTRVRELWKKWVIAFWGEAYFYRELGKMELPKQSILDDDSVGSKMAKSDPLLRKAMDMGDAEAYFYYGLPRYEVSEDNERVTWQKGWPFLLKAADLGYIDAMLRVGNHLMIGSKANKPFLKGSKDKESCLKGLRYLEAAAEQRSLDGLRALEAIYFERNTACTRKDLQKSAMYNLARYLLRGGGLDRDTLRAHREQGLTEEQAAHALVAAKALVDALPPDTKAEKAAEQRKRWAKMVPLLKQEINEQAPWIKWTLVPKRIRNQDRERALNATAKHNAPQ